MPWRLKAKAYHLQLSTERSLWERKVNPVHPKLLVTERGLYDASTY